MPLRALACLAALLLFAVSFGVRAAEVEDSQEEAPIRYRVTVDAPRALAETLRNTLDIVRWQDYEGTTAIVLERLMVEAKDQAREALEAEGYFQPELTVTLEPATGEDGVRTVRVRVTPGEPVRIATVGVNVEGPATTEHVYGTPAIAAARENWPLKPGERFQQSAWDDAKQRTLSALTASPYVSAHITQSEARIDPDALSAALSLTVDSGPLFRFGDFLVEGLNAYDPSLVLNFNTIDRGEPYTSERLNQYVRRLQGSNYFASVQASIDPDPARADAAPVRIAVIEAPRHRIEGGIGYSTDNSINSNFRYTDVNFNGRGTQLEVRGQVDSKTQNIGFTFTRPPSERGYIDSFHSLLEHTDISGLDTRTALIGVRRQTLEERDRTAYSLTYYEDDQRPADEPEIRSRALYGAYERSWRNVDALIAPTEGHVLRLELGAAPLATRIFGRVIGQAAWWVPLRSNNALFFRLEGGAVLAGARDGIPSVLLFRTGGDTTVRGYAFQSLGVQRNGVTLGGRYYAVGSAEATHWFNERFGAALFVDAGNAADDLSGLRPNWGYGTGLRVNSPIGPFRVDVAYGQETKGVRLHMSVGVTF